ncbi:hypothetical protein EDC01DRAFT_628244 [Geopyxis carbonaria]|nr:hypothetical protein EDC01DRAFT_628244 [Geopyxis carbonaria]
MVPSYPVIDPPPRGPLKAPPCVVVFGRRYLRDVDDEAWMFDLVQEDRVNQVSDDEAVGNPSDNGDDDLASKPPPRVTHGGYSFVFRQGEQSGKVTGPSADDRSAPGILPDSWKNSRLDESGKVADVPSVMKTHPDVKPNSGIGELDILKARVENCQEQIEKSAKVQEQTQDGRGKPLEPRPKVATIKTNAFDKVFLAAKNVFNVEIKDVASRSECSRNTPKRISIKNIFPDVDKPVARKPSTLKESGTSAPPALAVINENTGSRFNAEIAKDTNPVITLNQDFPSWDDDHYGNGKKESAPWIGVSKMPKVEPPKDPVSRQNFRPAAVSEEGPDDLMDIKQTTPPEKSKALSPPRQNWQPPSVSEESEQDLLEGKPPPVIAPRIPNTELLVECEIWKNSQAARDIQKYQRDLMDIKEDSAPVIASKKPKVELAKETNSKQKSQPAAKVLQDIQDDLMDIKQSSPPDVKGKALSQDMLNMEKEIQEIRRKYGFIPEKEVPVDQTWKFVGRNGDVTQAIQDILQPQNPTPSGPGSALQDLMGLSLQPATASGTSKQSLQGDNTFSKPCTSAFAKHAPGSFSTRGMPSLKGGRGGVRAWFGHSPPKPIKAPKAPMLPLPRVEKPFNPNIDEEQERRDRQLEKGLGAGKKRGRKGKGKGGKGGRQGGGGGRA